MANAKYPLAMMPAFTPQQLDWLEGHFYEEVGASGLDLATMAKQVGVNHVVVTIKRQMTMLKNKPAPKIMNHLTIGGDA